MQPIVNAGIHVIDRKRGKNVTNDKRGKTTQPIANVDNVPGSAGKLAKAKSSFAFDWLKGK